MSDYPYEYFAGANVFVLVNDQPILEVAGISYNEMDSQQPIYGYSSRLFDTVAPGQKIIQGKVVVNLVNPNYLYTAATFDNPASIISRGSSATTSPPVEDWRTQPGNFSNPSFENANADALKQKFWSTPVSNGSTAELTLKDITLMGPVSLQIEFANKFATVLDSCFFIGRSSVIQIDEHVILEEYSFFARNSYTKKIGQS
jgi:hypothetical protein